MKQADPAVRRRPACRAAATPSPRWRAAIVGQQISVKAAQAVWDRFVAPWRAVDTHDAGQRARAQAPTTCAPPACRRARSSTSSTWRSTSSRARPRRRSGSEMEDEAIIAELVAIRGIGRWTAEMFLIFHLLRPDVLPLDDLGLIKGISVNYFSGEPVSREPMRAKSAKPGRRLRSVATWYIWRSPRPAAGRILRPQQARIDAGMKTTFLEFEQPIAELESEDRRAALRAGRLGGRHLRRDRAAAARRASSSPRTSTAS